jgi:hypothetical protein
MRTLEKQPRPATHRDAVRVGVSHRADTAEAIDELLDQLHADRASFTFVFFSPDHDARTVSRRLDKRVGPRGVGGTTAGELSNLGFSHGTISGMSLHGDHVRVAADVIPNLDELSLLPLVHLPDEFARRLGHTKEDLEPSRHTWMLLSDGLSGNEELLTPFFMQSAPETNLVGGSLGDESRHERVELVYHGRTYTNAAALLLLEYDGPFEILHHNSLEFRETQLEVTSVSRSGRVLNELDGRPAAEAYAEAIGLEPEALTPSIMASNPLGFPFRGRPFTCSIVARLKGGRLQTGNAVHPGDTLRLLGSDDLVGSTRRYVSKALDDFESDWGTPAQGALYFNCVMRYIESRAGEEAEELSRALNQVPMAGLNTYGEQWDAIHTNHSLTGMLFG